MSKIYCVTTDRGLIEVNAGTATVLVTRDQALELLAEIAAEWIESAPAEADRTVARSLGDLLEAMSEALTRRTEI